MTKKKRFIILTKFYLFRLLIERKKAVGKLLSHQKNKKKLREREGERAVEKLLTYQKH